MADAHHEDRWRANIPADFDGRQGEHWDDEINIGIAYKSAIVVAASVAFSFVFCWFLIEGIDAFQDKPPASPIAEVNQRQLPPTPLLQSSPEEELVVMRGQLAERLHGYGWTDQLDNRVYIPVDKAMELVLEGSPRIAVEPSPEKPVDVQAPAPPAPDHAEPAAHAPAHGAGH